MIVYISRHSRTSVPCHSCIWGTDDGEQRDPLVKVEWKVVYVDVPDISLNAEGPTRESVIHMTHCTVGSGIGRRTWPTMMKRRQSVSLKSISKDRNGGERQRSTKNAIMPRESLTSEAGQRFVLQSFDRKYGPRAPKEPSLSSRHIDSVSRTEKRTATKRRIWTIIKERGC